MIRNLAAACAAALLLAGCSDEATVSGAGDAGAAAGPVTLAEHRAQADTFIGEGAAAYRARLAALKGTPVVVNQWASWCESCRFEFPFFRAAVARFSTRVAFLGLDSEDKRDSAEAFMREVPAGFPSVFDGDASVAREIGGGQSWPTTFFYDADGELTHVRVGAYATGDQLAADIERFAIAGESG